MMQQHSDTPVSKLRLAPWLSAFALVAGVGTLACLAGSWVQPSLDTSNVQVLAAVLPHAAAHHGATGSAQQQQQQAELSKRLEAALSVKNVEAALSERRLKLATTRSALTDKNVHKRREIALAQQQPQRSQLLLMRSQADQRMARIEAKVKTVLADARGQSLGGSSKTDDVVPTKASRLAKRMDGAMTLFDKLDTNKDGKLEPDELAAARTQKLWFGQGWYSAAKQAACNYFDALKGFCIGNSGEAPPAPAASQGAGHTGNPPEAPAPAPPGIDSFQKQCHPPYDGPECKGWMARMDSMKARPLQTQALKMVTSTTTFTDDPMTPTTPIAHHTLESYPEDAATGDDRPFWRSPLMPLAIVPFLLAPVLYFLIQAGRPDTSVPKAVPAPPPPLAIPLPVKGKSSSPSELIHVSERWDWAAALEEVLPSQKKLPPSPPPRPESPEGPRRPSAPHSTVSVKPGEEFIAGSTAWLTLTVCAKDGNPIELDKGTAVDLEFEPAHGARMLGIQRGEFEGEFDFEFELLQSGSLKIHMCIDQVAVRGSPLSAQVCAAKDTATARNLTEILEDDAEFTELLDNKRQNNAMQVTSMSNRRTSWI